MVGVGVRRAVLVVGLAWAGLLAGAAGALAQPAFTPGCGLPVCDRHAGPYSVAFSPSGGLLATANYGANTVSVFSVSAGGALTPVAGSPFAHRQQPELGGVQPFRRAARDRQLRRRHGVGVLGRAPAAR